MGVRVCSGLTSVRPTAITEGAEHGRESGPLLPVQVHKFESMEEVERLARVMRHYDIDGDVLPEAAAFGETIIKAGQLYFPNSPFLLLL